MTTEVPEKQRALVYEEYKGELKVCEIDVPKPKADEILVRLQYSGICHSDLHLWLGEMTHFPSILPLVGGHEGAGHVAALGADVAGWQVGDRAGVTLVNGMCHGCDMCNRGVNQLCAFSAFYGFTQNGTFQEYVAVKAIDATRLPAGCGLDVLAPVHCAGVTAYTGVKKSRVQAGEFLAISGAGGGLGTFGIQYAVAMGIRVIAIDVEAKRQHCSDLGAEFFVDALDPNLTKTIIEITGVGAHGMVNLASHKTPVVAAMDYVRRLGTIVLVGLPKDDTIDMCMTVMIEKVLTLKGNIVGNRQELAEALAFVGRGKVKVPIEHVSLGQVGHVYEKMQTGTQTGRAVVDFSL